MNIPVSKSFIRVATRYICLSTRGRSYGLNVIKRAEGRSVCVGPGCVAVDEAVDYDLGSVVSYLLTLPKERSRLNLVRTEDLVSALSLACQYGREEIALDLLSAGADGGLEDVHGQTILMFALANGMSRVVDILAQNQDLALNATKLQTRQFVSSIFEQVIESNVRQCVATELTV